MPNFTFCPPLDANVIAWGNCAQQAIGFNDPTFLGYIIILAIVVYMIATRQNIALGAMMSMGLSIAFYISNPAPVWVAIISGVLIVSIVLFIRGFKRNVE